MNKAILATKIGMTQIFDEAGVSIPVTVLQAGPCVVTQVKTEENDGYDAVQVGFMDIREKLVKTGHVDVMISVGNNFFYTKSLPCSLWFFDKGKTGNLQDKVLFIDARNYYTVVDRTLNEWNEWQLKNMNAIVYLIHQLLYFVHIFFINVSGAVYPLGNLVQT